jgi:chromosome segregation ATPase
MARLASLPLAAADDLQKQVRSLYDARDLAREELAILDAQRRDALSKTVNDWAADVREVDPEAGGKGAESGAKPPKG